MPCNHHKRHRCSDNHAYSRIGEISRLLTRIIRHGQRPSAGPPNPLAHRREAYAKDIVGRPMFQEFETTEADLVRMANDVEGDQKRRIEVIFGGENNHIWTDCATAGQFRRNVRRKPMS